MGNFLPIFLCLRLKIHWNQEKREVNERLRAWVFTKKARGIQSGASLSLRSNAPTLHLVFWGFGADGDNMKRGYA